MKILYLSQYFPPEMGAPAARVSELSRFWAKAGHDVTVLTGFPHYPSGVVPQEYRAKLRRLITREDFDGVRVERTWLAAPESQNLGKDSELQLVYDLRSSSGQLP